MIAEIITIGDEILVGQTVDTNSTWIANQLKLIGIAVGKIVSITDTEKAIIEALDQALLSSDLVLLTGGLGPTQDDITKSVLTNYFDDELVLHQEISNEIEAFFTSMNRPFLEVNRQQAMLPKKAQLILNDLGTASGMWFKKDGKDIISMPGVPYEMKGLLEKILPDLDAGGSGNFYHSTVLLQGIPESMIADKIVVLENKIREQGIGLAYLPSTGMVKIRLTATMEHKTNIDNYINQIATQFPGACYGFGEDLLEAVVGELLLEKNETVGTVESCTGGAIAHRIVSVPGSSAYYKGSIVSYAYELKEKLVNVSAEELDTNGAVSQLVVEQMAKGGIETLNVDYCIASSGIAGPDGGSTEKPVGTVWLAIASKNQVYSKKFTFKQNRSRNIESSVLYGLNYLRRVLIGLEKN